MKAAASKRRATLRGVEKFRFSDKDWKRLVNRFGGCCAYCGEKKILTLEHVVPISRGGRHSAGNIIPACFTCNSSKRDRFITEWRNFIPSPHQRRGRCVSQEEMAS
jgi:5-methylcytosine-specific restriction endonuclease McrA